MYEQEINQDLSKPSLQKLKVKRHIDQKDQNTKCSSQNDRIETGVLVKTRKGKKISVERKSGECYQWKAKGQCTEGNACSFRHDDRKRGNGTQSSPLAPIPQTQNDRKSFSKGKSPRGRVPSGKGYQKQCRKQLNGNCTNRSCDFDIVPAVNIIKHNRDANSVKSAYSGTEGLTA